MSTEPKQYGERNAIALDAAGGNYIRHVSAMTAEGLHRKSDIAAELAYRDWVIADLQAKLNVAEQDAKEQAELVGIGAERELKLHARIAELEANLKRATSALAAGEVTSVTATRIDGMPSSTTERQLRRMHGI